MNRPCTNSTSPTSAQPSTSSCSSLLSWLQSKATSLQGLSSRAPTLLLNTVDGAVLSGLRCRRRKTKSVPEQLRQGNDMFVYWECRSMYSVRQRMWMHYDMTVSVHLSVSGGGGICLRSIITPCHSHTCAVTGFLQAGTAAPWRWSNPPGRTAGSRRCASRRPLASSTAAWVHGARRGSPRHRAFCSPSPPAPAPHGCSCLQEFQEEERGTLVGVNRAQTAYRYCCHDQSSEQQHQIKKIKKGFKYLVKLYLFKNIH